MNTEVVRHPARPSARSGTPLAEVFERADLLDTRIGAAKQRPPAEVAKLGFEAMLKGDGDVVAGWTNKLRAAIAHVVPALPGRTTSKDGCPGTAPKS
jgi:hypothetical protein